jgi:hypothetical protein
VTTATQIIAIQAITIILIIPVRSVR